MKRGLFASIVGLVGGSLLLYFIWMWFFCRFYVKPGHMAIITAKEGQPLPPGEILAKKGQQGVQEDPLGEGRHFLNPWFYEVSIIPVINIPPGKVGVVTSKIGRDLADGEFLAEKGQKGIWKQVLGPGKYRLNPAGYHVDVIDAISIPIGFVGVVTSLAGEQAPESEFAAPHQKGVMQDILQPGLYYANNKQFKIDVLEIGVNQVSLLGVEGAEIVTKGHLASQNKAIQALESNVLSIQAEKREDYASDNRNFYSQSAKFRGMSSEGSGASQRAEPAERKGVAPKKARPSSPEVNTEITQFVEFPSRDGFEIKIDMTVEFELLPKNIAWIYRSYGDLPAVIDNIIMPQIQSISRLKGSAYRAKDFIVGEGREKFQSDLKNSLESTLGEKKLLIHNALIRHVTVPNQILDPIQKASLAIEEDLTNKEKQNTAKKQAELNTELSLIVQRERQVHQETEKLKAEIKAAQETEVARLSAETVKEVARIGMETSALRAGKTSKLGKAEAEVTRLVEGEKAAGFSLRTSAVGDSDAYNLFHFSQGLRNDVRINIIHAGTGTLWTDLKNATLGDLGGAKAVKQQQE
jgi:regulator of protease activity HflC (stomatin/prohibitin superfamily)